MERHYLKRGLEERLIELFKVFPVVVVSGARQVGKSTLLEHAYPNISRVVFDPSIDIENARADPELFLNHRKPPVILDEIQYAPELVSTIKRRLEKERPPGQYLLTGSQQWGVMKLLAESLAGRAVFLDLDGFSLQEISDTTPGSSWLGEWLTKSSEDFIMKCSRLKLPGTLFETIWRGSLPEAQFLEIQNIPPFHAAYLRTYVERDVRLLAEISDLQSFARFFRLCGALTAQEINYSEIGRELGLTPQTAHRWLDLLKATYQWYEIPPYSGNTIKRISTKGKGYLSDTGLACFGQAISTPDAISAHPLWGSLFETLMVSQVRKQCQLLNPPPILYHWRSHGGAEVDLLLEYNGKFYPIEVKGNSRPTGHDTRGIQAFREAYPHLKIEKGLVIAPAESAHPLSEDVVVIPWDLQ
ncbi:MAG: ATP-binding protein [Deltaproteobacteria bacterium]|nr:ATP-binding protein [Deltaproteobacteria bacterium]